jgi:hypothetical protein
LSLLPFDIHDAKTIWANCQDRRPWIVIEVRADGHAACFPISGQCYDDSDCFPITLEDPDFSATGLKKDCFIHYQRLIELPPEAFLKKRGTLAGNMLKRFCKVAGIQ